MQFTHKKDGTIIVNKRGFGPIVFPQSKIEILRLPDYQLKYFENKNKALSNESQTSQVSALEKRDLSHVSVDEKVPLESVSPENHPKRLITKIKLQEIQGEKKIRKKKKKSKTKRSRIERVLSPVVSNKAQSNKIPQRPSKTNSKDNKVSKKTRPAPAAKKSCIDKSSEPLVRVGDAVYTLSSIIDVGPQSNPQYQIQPLSNALWNYKIPKMPPKPPPQPEVPEVATETDPSPISDDHPEKPDDDTGFDKVDASCPRSQSPPDSNKDFNDEDTEDLGKVDDSSRNSSPSPSTEKDFNDNDDEELENADDSSRSPSPPPFTKVRNDDDDDVLDLFPDMSDDDFL